MATKRGCPCGCKSKPPYLDDPECKRHTAPARPTPPVVSITVRGDWALVKVTPSVDLDMLLLMFGLPRMWSSSGRGWLIPARMANDIAAYAEYRRCIVRVTTLDDPRPAHA